MTEQEIEKYIRGKFPTLAKILDDLPYIAKFGTLCFTLGEIHGITQGYQNDNQMFKGYNAVSIKQ